MDIKTSCQDGIREQSSHSAKSEGFFFLFNIEVPIWRERL